MAKLGRRAGGPRGTTVARTPYWQPENEQWVFIPTGSTHRQSLEETDSETGEPVFSQDQYQAKGWVPVHQVPPNDPRRILLAKNWQAMSRDHKTVPELRKDAQEAYKKAAA